MLIIPAIVEFFRHQAVGSIIVLACWPSFENIKLTREFSKLGVATTISCDPAPLATVGYRLQGVVYFNEGPDDVLAKVKTKQFALLYKWLIIGREVPEIFNYVRYDVDVAVLDINASSIHDEINNKLTDTNRSNSIALTSPKMSTVNINDIYVHPADGVSIHPWGTWSEEFGLKIDGALDRRRVLRRLDLKGYPLSIVTPIGLYTPECNQSFHEYLRDISNPGQDPGIRIGYGISNLIVEKSRATEVIHNCIYWTAESINNSMIKIVAEAHGDLTGATLRILPSRTAKMDIVTYTWHFHVGFIFLAERDSSSNMFVAVFSEDVWWCVLAFIVLLALAQRLTARTPHETEGAFISVLATWLQQDASAAPNGISGRWTFTVMSISSMLVHAYYTSAIVSALMSAGTNGPDSLAALADSKYDIASQDVDWIRHLFFEVETDSAELEYLKKKKKTSKFYQDVVTGMELVRQGGTAYHAEYNRIYPHLKKFTDDQICKLDRVETVPAILSYIFATREGQWTPLLRATAAWIHETGLAERLVSRIKLKPPPCRASLLAERVRFDDIAPLLGLTALGGLLSLMLLSVEVIVAKYLRKGGKKMEISGDILEDEKFEQ